MMSHSKAREGFRLVTICDIGGGGGLSVVMSCKTSFWYVLSVLR